MASSPPKLWCGVSTAINAAGRILLNPEPDGMGYEIGPTPPATSVQGDLWFDTNAPATLKIYNGTAWVAVGTGAFLPLTGGTLTDPTAAAGGGPGGPLTMVGGFYSDITYKTLYPGDGTLANATVWQVGLAGLDYFYWRPIQAQGSSLPGDMVMTLDASGNVILTGDLHALDVYAKLLLLAPSPTTPLSTVPGTLWYDSTAGQGLKVYNGTAWTLLGGAGGNFLPLAGGTMDDGGVIRFPLSDDSISPILFNDGSGGVGASLSSFANDLYIWKGAYYPPGATGGFTVTTANSNAITGLRMNVQGFSVIIPDSPLALNTPLSWLAYMVRFNVTNTSASFSVPLQLRQAATDPITGFGAGTIYYNNASNVIRLYTGTAWVSVGGGPWAPLTNPANGQQNYAPINNATFTGTTTLAANASTALHAVPLQQLQQWNNAAGTAAPTPATAGRLWFDTTAGQGLKTYNGTAWVLAGTGNWLPINNPAFTGLMTGPQASLTLATGSGTPPVANVLALTSNGNWNTNASINNSGTGQWAASSIYLRNNIAIEYAAISLNSSGASGISNEAPPRTFLIASNALSGISIASADSDNPNTGIIRFWNNGFNCFSVWNDDWTVATNSWADHLAADRIETALWRMTWTNPLYRWQWNNGNGDMTWYTDADPLGFWIMRRIDNLCFNRLGRVGGVGAYMDLSDIRTKTAIEPERHGLDVVRQLNPIDFERLVGPQAQRGVPPRREVGFSSQDVQAVFPEAVMAMGVELPDGSGGIDSDAPTLGVATTALIAVLVNAVKELDKRLTDIGH